MPERFQQGLQSPDEVAPDLHLIEKSGNSEGSYYNT